MAPARERAEKGQQLPNHLESLEQLLVCGSVPEEADPAVWSNFGTLTNGQLEIRESKVKRVIGDYALGRGLFALREYAQNEIITVYGGELITREEANLRKEAHESPSRRYLMRISDTDFVVDGWQFASGISDTPTGPDGCFLPVSEDATQWMQGCAAMANHDPANHNAYLSFVTLDVRSEAARLYPRIPTLKANRRICQGEEILINYGSSMPFTTRLIKETDNEGDEEKAAAEPPPSALQAPAGGGGCCWASPEAASMPASLAERCPSLAAAPMPLYCGAPSPTTLDENATCAGMTDAADAPPAGCTETIAAAAAKPSMHPKRASIVSSACTSAPAATS